jgi:hypothetical protein
MIKDLAGLIFGAILMAVVCGGPIYWTLMAVHAILTGQP